MEWHIHPFFLYPALPRVRRIMQAKFGVLSTTQHTLLPVKKKIEYERKSELKYVKISEVHKVLLDCLLKEFVNPILKNTNISIQNCFLS